jgi:hypothetical protein
MWEPGEALICSVASVHSGIPAVLVPDFSQISHTGKIYHGVTATSRPRRIRIPARAKIRFGGFKLIFYPFMFLHPGVI